VQAGYDDAGRVLWLENEKGERYAFEHDSMNRMVNQTDIGGVRHSGSVWLKNSNMASLNSRVLLK